MTTVPQVQLQQIYCMCVNLFVPDCDQSRVRVVNNATSCCSFLTRDWSQSRTNGFTARRATSLRMKVYHRQEIRRNCTRGTGVRLETVVPWTHWDHYDASPLCRANPNTSIVPSTHPSRHAAAKHSSKCHDRCTWTNPHSTHEDPFIYDNHINMDGTPVKGQVIDTI